MSSQENPYDNTIWDSQNPEHAIEDPLHGPSAVFNLLQIPAMPYGDGTYYQPGAFYALGSGTVDVNGQPLLVFNVGNPSIMMREVRDMDEWVTTYHNEGEEGLAQLEANRQQERLARNGFVQAFKDSDICGGGKRLDNCETALEMRVAAQDFADKQTTERPSEGIIMNELLQLTRKCGSCALNCSVALQTNNGKPTDITRITNTKLTEGRLFVMNIDESSLKKVDDNDVLDTLEDAIKNINFS